MALGLEKSYIEKKMNLESGYDFFTANDYPSRQHSENRIGQFAHIDPGLIILIIQNVSGGLQVKHNGKWLNVNLQPDWIFVNVADHLEVYIKFCYVLKYIRRPVKLVTDIFFMVDFNKWKIQECCTSSGGEQ